MGMSALASVKGVNQNISFHYNVEKLVDKAQMHGCIVVDTIVDFSNSTKKRTNAFVESSSLEGPPGQIKPANIQTFGAGLHGPQTSIVCIRVIQAPR